MPGLYMLKLRYSFIGWGFEDRNMAGQITTAGARIVTFAACAAAGIIMSVVGLGTVWQLIIPMLLLSFMAGLSSLWSG